ncbi:hypothetical protein Tco_0595292, partial [Tanacetum coccineum]
IKLWWKWRYFVPMESIHSPMLTLNVFNQRHHDNQKTYNTASATLITARKRVRPFPAHRLAWRRVSHHSSDRHSLRDSSPSSSSSDSSSYTSSGSSSDSLSDSSSVHSSGCDSSGQAHSGPLTRVVSPRLLDSSSHSARPSRKRCRSPTTSIASSTHVLRLISLSPVDLLPPRKRFKDSYSPKGSREEHMENGIVDAKAIVDLGISEGVGAPTEDGLGLGVEIVASDVREDEEEIEAEANAAGTREITVDPLATKDSSESSRRGILDLEDTLEAGQLIASVERAGLSNRVRSLRLEYLKVRSMLSIKRDQVGSLCWHMALSQEEFHQVCKGRDDTQRRLCRLESFVKRRLGFRP